MVEDCEVQKPTSQLAVKQVKKQNRLNMYGVRQECGSIHRRDTP